MEKKLVTVEDLQQFKVELLRDIKKLLANAPAPLPNPWLKSHEVQKMLKISPGTLQHLRELREIIREEMKARDKGVDAPVSFETPGLSYKPLYKMKEVCALLSVTRPTIYDWVKHGKLKPYKIRSRVYFLWDDVRALIQPGQE